MKPRHSAIAACALLGGASLILSCRAVLGFEPLTAMDDAATLPADGSTTQDGGEAGGDAAEAGCVTDLTVDPKHCGRCGHDCGGGTCESGKCQPVRLADGLASPEGIVVDATDVFVAEWDQHRILKLGKTAGGPCAGTPLAPSCVFAAGTAHVWRPTALGIDAQNVYWANTGAGTAHEIRSCPRAGCGGQSAAKVAQLGDEALGHLFGEDVLPLELVVRDGQVFWPESMGGAIRSAPVGGGPVTTYLESGGFMPLAIAVDDQDIFFTDDTNQHPTRIQSVPRDGSARDGGAAVKIIADTPARPYGIGLSASGDLYWTVPFIAEDGDGVVQAAPKTGAGSGGGAIGAVAASQLDPRALIVDAKNVYWLQTGSTKAATGMLVYCPLSGCPNDGPIVLASQQRAPRHLTQDDQMIYWSNEGLTSSSTDDGQVWKIAKP